ncbi:Uncharacterised protein [Klebsiella quasipneumoniae]|nr:Uncharacterised protein [Klebsiella quasipneumoniae]
MSMGRRSCSCRIDDLNRRKRFTRNIRQSMREVRLNDFLCAMIFRAVCQNGTRKGKRQSDSGKKALLNKSDFG